MQVSNFLTSIYKDSVCAVYDKNEHVHVIQQGLNLNLKLYVSLTTNDSSFIINSDFEKINNSENSYHEELQKNTIVYVYPSGIIEYKYTY
jgi:hypothetical protein